MSKFSSKELDKGTQKTVKSTQQKPAYPFWLGGVAASGAAFLTHPLDVSKVKLQTSKYTGMIKTMVYAVRNDGFFRGAYPGLSASLLRQMTYSLTRFGVYEAAKQRLKSPGEKALPAYKMAIAGSIAGALGGVAGNPADIILVRMIGDSVKPAAERHNYKNCFDGLFRMIREEGFSSLYRGLGPNVTRAVLMNASQLATYDVFKAMLLATPVYEEGMPLHFSASFLAGTVATTVCSPFDVLRSRIMNTAGDQSVLQVVSQSYRKEGLSWAFKGFVPAWIRLTPNTIAIMLILEQLRKVVDVMRT